MFSRYDLFFLLCSRRSAHSIPIYRYCDAPFTVGSLKVLMRVGSALKDPEGNTTIVYDNAAGRLTQTGVCVPRFCAHGLLHLFPAVHNIRKRTGPLQIEQVIEIHGVPAAVCQRHTPVGILIIRTRLVLRAPLPYCIHEGCRFQL